MTQTSEPVDSGVPEDFDTAIEVSERAGLSRSSGSQFEEPIRRSVEFDAHVEEIRNLGGSNLVFPFAWFEDQIRRRLGVPPLTLAAALLSGLVGIGVRLTVALGATSLIGEWAEVPWGRWTVVLVFYALYDGTQSWRTPPLDVPAGPVIQRMTEEGTALLQTMVRESDLRDLAAFFRRFYRLGPAVMTGVVYAAGMVLACWTLAPTAMDEVPVGSIALLILLLFEVGSIVVFGVPMQGVLFAREAKYDHRLFWASPADSPEVKSALRTGIGLGWSTGTWVTLYLGLAVVLVSWDSPAVIPLAGGFILTAYLIAIATTLWVRASIQKIVQKARARRLQGLRDRIEDFGPGYTDLSPQDSQQLRDLLFLHHDLRDAPTTPTTTRTLVHTAITLIIPTILFLATVLGEVYTERFLDAFLP